MTNFRHGFKRDALRDIVDALRQYDLDVNFAPRNPAIHDAVIVDRLTAFEAGSIHLDKPSKGAFVLEFKNQIANTDLALRVFSCKNLLKSMQTTHLDFLAAAAV